MNAQLKSLGLTPTKAALIGVLLVVFAVVWGPQLLGGGGKSAAQSSAKAKPAGVPERRPAKPSDGSEVASAGWLESEPSDPIEFAFALSDVAEFDPFDIPSWSPAARRSGGGASSRARNEPAVDRFKAIQDSGVAMILVSGEQRAAQVGDRTVVVGDEIDGFRVTAINAAGVVFEPIDETEGADLGP